MIVDGRIRHGAACQKSACQKRTKALVAVKIIAVEAKVHLGAGVAVLKEELLVGLAVADSKRSAAGIVGRCQMAGVKAAPGERIAEMVKQKAVFRGEHRPIAGKLLGKAEHPVKMRRLTAGALVPYAAKLTLDRF